MSERDKGVARSPKAVSTGTKGPPLAGVEGLVQGTVAELDRLLDTKQVVGEPMTFGKTTVIPLVSLGFGFGAGGGGGGDDEGSGGGGGGMGGGGVKPIAVIVIDEEGVRLSAMPVNPTGLDKLGEAIAGAIQKRGDKTTDEEG